MARQNRTAKRPGCVRTITLGVAIVLFIFFVALPFAMFNPNFDILMSGPPKTTIRAMSLLIPNGFQQPFLWLMLIFLAGIPFEISTRQKRHAEGKTGLQRRPFTFCLLILTCMCASVIMVGMVHESSWLAGRGGGMRVQRVLHRSGTLHDLMWRVGWQTMNPELGAYLTESFSKQYRPLDPQILTIRNAENEAKVVFVWFARPHPQMQQNPDRGDPDAAIAVVVGQSHTAAYTQERLHEVLASIAPMRKAIMDGAGEAELADLLPSSDAQFPPERNIE